MELRQSFCKYIRNLREEKRLPLRKVAAVLDMDPSTLSKIERGERIANDDIVDKLALLFKVSRDHLRLMYLSDKIAYEIWKETNTKEILQVAEEKIEYIKQTNLNQQEIEFN